MTGTLSDREGRLVAAAILLAVLAVAWTALAAPLLAGFDARRTRREQAQSELDHAQRRLARAPRDLDERTALQSAARPLLLEAASEPQARLGAQLRLRRAAAAEGATVTDIHIAPASAPIVTLEADLHGSFAQIVLTLKRLQSEQPAAVFTHVVLSRPDGGGPDSNLVSLNAHLALSFAYRAKA